MKPKLQDVDLKLLRVFREVARHEGFSTAQDALNTTQSAISVSMSQLEGRLGMRLCDRGVKGFRLTEHGKEVLVCTDRLFAALDEFRSDTARLKGRIIGSLYEYFPGKEAVFAELRRREGHRFYRELIAEPRPQQPRAAIRHIVRGRLNWMRRDPVLYYGLRAPDQLDDPQLQRAIIEMVERYLLKDDC